MKNKQSVRNYSIEETKKATLFLCNAIEFRLWFTLELLPNTNTIILTIQLKIIDSSLYWFLVDYYIMNILVCFFDDDN